MLGVILTPTGLPGLKWVENTKRMELQARSEESMNRSHVVGDDGDEHEIGGPDFFVCTSS